MATKHLISLETDLPWKLRDLKLVSVTQCDGKSGGTPDSIGYYREPLPAEYPINLKKGNLQFIPSEPDCNGEEQNCLKYLMSQRHAGGEFDFCTNRGTLVKMLTKFDFDFLAIKFRGCIYIKNNSFEQTIHDAQLLQLKLFHNIIVDAPGGNPDIKKPIDHSKQNFGTFSAKLGKFRLLYTADIIGVENTEPLGDLNDPNVLQQCKLAIVKLYPKNSINVSQNYRMKRWLLQAHFAGIDHIKMAGYTKSGFIPVAITTKSFDKLIEEQEWCLSNELALLHFLLSEIREVMANIDCPYTTYIFKLKDKSVSYKRLEDKTKQSFLSREFIDFVLES